MGAQLELIPHQEVVAPTVKPVSLQDRVDLAVDGIQGLIRSGRRLLIATSFGKDSSVMLALVIMAIRSLAERGHRVPTVHVMHADTGLHENPVVQAYAHRQIDAVRDFADAQNLPLKVWVASPGISNQYLVNMIGGRTVATVGGMDRKCQQSLKAAPLGKLRRAIAAELRQGMGLSYSPQKVVTLIATRRDESVARGAAMAARGESSMEPVNLEADSGGDYWVYSPLAEWGTMDVFSFIADVTNGRRRTYSDFAELTEVYRDAGGDCMVNLHLRGEGERRAACGQRTGCWCCTAVASDRSMESMLQNEQYRWMRGLNDLRNYILAKHYDPASRCWLSRKIDKTAGQIRIAPNSYSPQMCQDLLRFACTLDAVELEDAERLGIEPRFQLLGPQQIVAIELLHARYGYHRPFEASSIWKDIHLNGARYAIPTGLRVHSASELKEVSAAFDRQVPFADDQFWGPYEGMRSIAHALGDCEDVVVRGGVTYTRVVESNEFDIDLEGASLFLGMELDYAVAKYRGIASVPPAAGLHYLFGLGVAALFKNSYKNWDDMLRMSNQVHRHGLTPYLSSPAELVARLARK